MFVIFILMESNKLIDNPFFSIVIPLYNKAEYIIDTLNSVKNQTYKNFEVILINDGSTDNSSHKLEQISDTNFHIINQENQGVSVARNNGIKNATGDYIAFLDADDYWYPNHLSEFIKSIKKHANESVFCNNYRIYQTKNKFKKTLFSYLPNNNQIQQIDNYFKSSFINDIAWTSAVCIKKNVFNTYTFDNSLRSTEDTDLWIRLGLTYSFIFNTCVTAKQNKYVKNSLSKLNNLESKQHFLSKYIQQESQNSSLKKYIDYNRFAIALEAKERKEIVIYKKIIKGINRKNLNLKQQLLLNSPRWVIQILKKIKLLLEKSNINILLYK